MTTAIIFLGCSTIMLIQKKTNTVGFTQFREQWKGILGVAILSILAIWSSDCSMMYIGVTLNQLLKACTPFPTMLFGMCIERKTFAWPMMLAVLMIVVGAGLAVPMADATGSTYGLIMAGLSTLFAACKISLAARLMSDSANNGLTPLILLFYSSLASVPVHVETKPDMAGQRGPSGWWAERSLRRGQPARACATLLSTQVPVLLIWFLAIDERSEVPEYIAENPGLAFVVLFLASIYAFLVNLLGNTLTKITSALTMTIAGAGRQIGIIVVTGVFIEHTFSVRRGPSPPHAPFTLAAAPPRSFTLARLSARIAIIARTVGSQLDRSRDLRVCHRRLRVHVVQREAEGQVEALPHRRSGQGQRRRRQVQEEVGDREDSAQCLIGLSAARSSFVF